MVLQKQPLFSTQMKALETFAGHFNCHWILNSIMCFRQQSLPVELLLAWLLLHRFHSNILKNIQITKISFFFLLLLLLWFLLLGGVGETKFSFQDNRRDTKRGKEIAFLPSSMGRLRRKKVPMMIEDILSKRLYDFDQRKVTRFKFSQIIYHFPLEFLCMLLKSLSLVSTK